MDDLLTGTSRVGCGPDPLCLRKLNFLSQSWAPPGRARQGGLATLAQPPATMDLWLEEPSARTPGSDELHFQPLCKQSVLLMLKAYDPAAQTLRVRARPPRARARAPG